MTGVKKKLLASALILVAGIGSAAPVVADDATGSQTAETVSAEKLVVTAKSVQGIEDLGMSVSVEKPSGKYTVIFDAGPGHIVKEKSRNIE